MGTWRPLTRVLGRTRQLPAGDVLNGVYPPYTPLYRNNGSMLPLYRRDGIAQGVSPYVPVFQENGAELRIDTDANFALTVTLTAGATRLVNAGAAGVTQKVAYQFANLAAFPAIGSSERVYVAADTRLEYAWSGNGYVLANSVAGSSIGSTDDVPEGVTNLYFTGARVLSAVLTGLSTATSTAITAADTVLVAMGKLQAQINGKLGLTANAVSATKLVTPRNINTVPFDGTADIAIANIITGVEAGYASNNGSGTNWAASIWGMGPGFGGSGFGAAYSPAGSYGFAWVRTSHSSADVQVGEGVYLYQNGVLKGGMGTAGVKTTGVFYGNGSGLTNLDAGSLATGTVPSARLSGTYSINVTGNAGSATVLQTARTINGVAFNGSANITIPTSGGVFTASFTSSDIALTVSTYASFAHGLGITPLLFFGRIKCVIAEKGYSIGDIVNIDPFTLDQDGGGTTSAARRGFVVGATTTAIFAQIGNSTISIPDKNAGANYGTITPANWRLVLYAFA